jgi:hypothetical protein
MADEREDLPNFDEFGDIVETIQTDQEGLDYSQPRKWIGPKFRGRPPEIKGEEYADLRTLDEIIAAGTAERSQDIDVFTSVTGALLSWSSKNSLWVSFLDYRDYGCIKRGQY